MPRSPTTPRDRLEVYATSKHHDGVGVSMWGIYDPKMGEIIRVESEPLIACRSAPLLTMNGLIAGLSKLEEGAVVTGVANRPKLIEMAQRLGHYRNNGFRSSGKPIANVGEWKLMDEVVSKRSVDFRTFGHSADDRRILRMLLERADLVLTHGRS